MKGGGRKESDVINPATDEVIGKLPHAGRPTSTSRSQRAEGVRVVAQVLAIERAASCARWPSSPVRTRRRSAATSRSTWGKPLAEAAGEVTVCSEHADWAAEECRRIYGRDRRRAPTACASSCSRSPSASWRRILAVEFPVQPGDPQDRLGAGRRLHHHHQGPRGRAQRVVAIARMFHEAGLPPGCLNVVWGVPSEGLDLPHQLADRAQDLVHGLGAGGQAARRRWPGALMKPRDDGARRPLAGDRDGRRRRRKPPADIMAGSKFRNRRPGVRLAHAFLRAGKAYDKFVAPLTSTR
jgi:succinate-semialdehyde dehydrogenase/glutarate-semialdehyde dehydrogenase